MPIRGDEDIRWLDVAMDDALCVSCLKRVSDLDCEVQQRVDFQRLDVNFLLQSMTFQKFHCNKGLVTGFADLVNCANVGMIEGRSSPGFAPEAFQRLRVFHQFLWQELQGHMTPEAEIFSLVNDPHPPALDSFQNAIV